jgi:hypothetical protein
MKFSIADFQMSIFSLALAIQERLMGAVARR